MMFRSVGFTIFFGVCLVATSPSAQVAGQVIDVTPSAQVGSGASARTVVVGSTISSGDLIKTSQNGQVQILFEDDTKIVVGPNSTLRIDDALFRKNGTAR